ncbi:MAG: shikimate kinase [Planctomycetota bacterium]
MNLLLIGHRGSGKSTVGQLLATRLDYRFTDTDEIIIEQSGRTIADIFARDGEQAFRRMEKKVLESLRKAQSRVISLGGGSVMDPDNRVLVRRLGKVVWLRAPAAVLWSRISKDPHTSRTRPNLTASGGLAEVESVLEEREPVYQSIANQIIDTMTMTSEEVADSIEMWFQANDMEAG